MVRSQQQIIAELKQLSDQDTGNLVLNTIRDVQYRAALTRLRRLDFCEDNLAYLIERITHEITDVDLRDTLISTARSIAEQMDAAHALDIAERDAYTQAAHAQSQGDNRCRHGKLFSERCSQCDKEFD